MSETSQGAPRARVRVSASRWVALVVVLVSVSLGIALLRRGEAPPPVSGTTPPSSAIPAAARRETRPTLDPAQFVGKAAEAHRVAREIPDVLDQLYCYCGCDKHEGHKSLLSCYTDGHAAT